MARAMFPLSPVARTAQPISVPKNQYSTAIITTATSPPTRMACGMSSSVIIVGWPSRLTLARPMMRRLIE